MSMEEFNEIFRDEHRQLRDVLLGLIDAFQSNDSERAREGIAEMAEQAAPHFHYEQEALYPALADVHGDEYVEKLLDEHAQAIAAAQQLAELAEQEELNPEEFEYGLDLVRQLLPHVSDRDGLAVMVEVLEPEVIKKIHKAQKESKSSGVNLAALHQGAKKGKAKTRKAAGIRTKGTRVVVAPQRVAKASRAAKPAKAPRAKAVKRGFK